MRKAFPFGFGRAWRPWLLIGALSVSQGFSGCSAESEEHLGQAALAQTKALLEAFPQRYAGEHSLAVAEWIAQQLPEGARVETFESPRGTLANVHYDRPDAVAVLVSHFDTKRGIDGFVGANDGGSTTGLLLALARESDLPVNYLFVDGEECLVRYHQNDGLHGSWHVARSGAYKSLPIFVLDMLGDRQFTPMIAANGHGELRHRFFKAARALEIPLADTGEVIDDHVPFLAQGYRTIDLIDFDYPPWHTAEDTLDKLSETSFASTIRLLRAVIQDLQKDPLK